VQILGLGDVATIVALVESHRQGNDRSKISEGFESGLILVSPVAWLPARV